MNYTFGKKLLITAAIATMWTAIAPGVLSAQTSGVGCDGYTRFLWRGTDSRISLWRVDGNLNNSFGIQYGPYDGWVPVALTVLCNNYTYVMWKYTDGSISLWKVDPNLNYVTSRVYGPYAGWIPESLSPDQTYTGKKEKKTQNGINRHRLDTVVGPGISLNKIICSDDKACNTQYSQYDSEHSFFHNIMIFAKSMPRARLKPKA